MPLICKNVHETVSVQLGDLPLMSNSHVELAMDCNSSMGFFTHSSVELGKLLQSFVKIVQDFIRRSHLLCLRLLPFQEVSPECANSHFELWSNSVALLWPAVNSSPCSATCSLKNRRSKVILPSLIPSYDIHVKQPMKENRSSFYSLYKNRTQMQRM